VPAQAWCDWEALKLAALLGDGRAAWESSVRLSARAPHALWKQRETTPALVADVLCVIVGRLDSRRERVLRLCDQLADQADSEREKQHIAVVRHTLHTDGPVPMPLLPRVASVPPNTDADAWLSTLREAYRKGKVRDEDLLLDPSYAGLRAKFALADVLRVPRAFA
jgi:hypothetical protein